MKSLQEYVTRIFYTHGLFCASHPYSILSVVICIMLTSFYPLVNMPLPGNVPLQHREPLVSYRVPSEDSPKTPTPQTGRHPTDLLKPPWYLGVPVGYIQQIIVKATVSPWKQEYMIPEDAFRSPLLRVFEILEELEKFKFRDGSKEYALSDVCLRVGEVLPKIKFKEFLPEYSCLTLSPANFWFGRKDIYLGDGEILKTLFKRHGQPLETPPYLRDVLFGVPWKSSGISRYFIRNQQRTISFAVSIALKTYDQRFLLALRSRLEDLYPETAKNVNNSQINSMVHIHYPNSKVFTEHTYLIITYVFLLMYIYFSVRKIEMVKSKWGLALSAVVTVVTSLLMSVSFCSLFGLTPTLNGGEIFPYLVVFVGLENVLVITKSVVSTPLDQDVRFRIAQGISREGWSITKNLATELIIVVGGFFTFVPAIQEFALFAMVGLLTDFFLQHVFFLTTLSIDIRRMELSDLHKNIRTSVSEGQLGYPPGSKVIEPLVLCPVRGFMSASSVEVTDKASQKKHRRTSSNVSLGPPSSLADTSRMSRRLRLIDFLADTRVIQRFIMFCTVVWIGLIVYKSGVLEHFSNPNAQNATQDSTQQAVPPAEELSRVGSREGQSTVRQSSRSWWFQGELVDPEGAVKHREVELWQDLSYKHWPTLFGYYNISLYGKFISILPSLHLSVIVDPNEAISLRHPSENAGKTPQQIKKEIEQISQEQMSEAKRVESDVLPDDSIKGLLDSLPNYVYDSDHLRKLYDPEELKKLYPKSQRELVSTLLLVLFSAICLSYFALALYHCICPKNYARWRSRWFRGQHRKREKTGEYYKQIKESVPKVLKGHLQEIECVATDGQYIISACLGGQLRVWDSITGDCVTVIHRKGATPPVKRKPCLGRNINDSDADLYAEYHGNGSHSNSSDPEEGDCQIAYHRQKTDSQGLAMQGKKLFQNQPNLSGTIHTNFFQAPPSPVSHTSPTSLDPPTLFTPGSSPLSSTSLSQLTSDSFDFQSRFQPLFDEHTQYLTENPLEEDVFPDVRSRSWSAGDNPLTTEHDAALFDSGFEGNNAPAIWCLACCQGLIVTGCGNGRIEFWESTSGNLKYIYGENQTGVTALCIVNKRVVAARLDGSLDFLEIETFHNPIFTSPIPSTSSHIKGHVRHHSQHKVVVMESLKKWEEILHVTLVKYVKAHQQPIMSLKCEGGRVISASQDHSLKVFRLEDCWCLYTLYGHTTKITALHADKSPPFNVASGDAEGTTRLWDLHTGTCLHKVKVHEAAVVALTCTIKYVISSGLDDRLCLWDRKRGTLVHELEMDPCGNNCMSLLTSHLLVLGGQGYIQLIDLDKGEILRRVSVGSSDKSAFVNQIHVVQNTVIVCDYASEMKVIQFPTVLEKSD
ncbi:sterol regulatory element-binding protein cleavage-activating protein-like [Ostrea edulis]|uniref:sterol regulatory element-binding protein cleavage-activating protein-like n=1 Tax=Ostrea edulis TaxID=37623 RepID=UPI0024AFED45|nr:sterol regulatory element-binding protein cleavage-activating protein-like [Ostrea edulis]